MDEIPFYLQKPQDNNELPSFLQQYHVEDLYGIGKSTKPMSDLLSEELANHSRTRTDLNNLYNKNMERINKYKKVPKTLPSAWKDNIDYTKGYSSEIEDKFRSEHDYLGLADYLSKFKMNNIMDQRAYEQEISQLRRYGRQYNAIQANATDEQRESIAFLEAFNSGNIDNLDNDNDYKKRYTEAISILGKPTSFVRQNTGNYAFTSDYSGGKESSTITVAFNTKHVSEAFWGWGPDWLAKDTDENQYELFSKDTGYSPSEIRNILGDNCISTKEGKIIVTVPKSNIEGIKFLTTVRNWCNDTGRTENDVSYASYDTEGNLLDDHTVEIGNKLQRISDIIKKVNNDKNIIENINLMLTDYPTGYCLDISNKL